MGKSFTKSFFAFCFILSSSFIKSQSGAALNFDGVNDRISIPNSSSLQVGGGNFTIEYWAKPTLVNGTFQYVVTKDHDNSSMEFLTGMASNNRWLFYTKGLNYLQSNASAVANTWYHIACTYDGNFSYLYVNGELQGVLAVSSSPLTNNANILIGARTATAPNQFFTGNIDEVRIWNVARTQCQIQSFMNAEITSTASGLIANYHFNQGLAALANSTITSLTDATGNLNTGTLNGFALTGSTSNWISPGGVVSGFSTASTPSAEINITGNAISITDGDISTSSIDFTDFGTIGTRTFVIQNTGTGSLALSMPYLTGPNASEFTVTTLASTISAASTSSNYFVIAFTPTAGGARSATINLPNNDCDEPIYDFAITASATAASALDFDGANDFISIPHNANQVPATDLTIEGWIKADNTGTTTTNMIIMKGTYGYGLALGNTGCSGGAKLNYWTSSSCATALTSTGSIPYNVWTHVAVVVKTSPTQYLEFFINGVSAGTYTSGININNGFNGALIIGQQGTGCACNFFKGDMDELRIWNTSRTQCEIQTYMNAEITSTASGLVANYHFNDGASGLSNTTFTTLTDATGINSGVLTNFALTSTLSNWVSPGGVTNGNTVTTSPGQSLTLSGNGNNIAFGSTSTSTLNFTNFGSVNARTFVLQNAGSGTLSISSVSITGANAAQFSISVNPISTLLTSVTSSMTVLFTPTAVGTYSAVVNINSNDCANPTFSFVIGATIATPSVSCFNTATSFSAGSTPYSVDKGDFNLDGKIDLVVANQAGNNVSILLGIGNGSFAAAVNYNVGTNPYSVISKDFNNDGNLDLAVANRNSSNVSILLGSSSGTFASAVNYAVGTNPHSLISTDFNSDGKADLAVSNYNSNNVSVLLGNGSGGFAAAVNYAAGSNPHSVSYGDFNNDSKPDLAITNASSNNISILIGSSSGTFAAAVNFNVGSSPRSAFAADFNNDGKMDLATANVNSNDVSVLIGNGSGSFATALNYSTATGPYFVIAADFNGDGKTDIATPNYASNNISILLGTNTGAFATAANFAVGSTPQSMVSSDFNGDGKMDIAVANAGSNNVSILMNAPALSIASTPTTICAGNSLTLIGSGANTYTWSTASNSSSIVVSPSITTSYSLSGSHALGCTSASPAVVTISVNPLPIISITGSNTACAGNSNSLILSAASNYGAGTGPYSICSSDFNGDGNSDLAIANISSNNVSILLGTLSGTFAAAVNYPAGINPISGITADFNKDGKADLAFANASSNNVSVLLGTGTGSFGAVVAYAVGTGPEFVTTSDLNNDGLMDLISSNYTSSNVSVLYGTSAGSFATAVNFTVGSNPKGIISADFNNDGKNDIAVNNGGSNNLSVLINLGSGNFASPVNYAVGGSAIGLTYADFNNDGNNDLVSCNPVANNLSILLGSASGTFAAASTFSAANYPYSSMPNDVNGDGKIDLIVANFNSNNISVHLGLGTGSFATAVNYAAGTGPQYLTSADFNKDGKADIAVANLSSNNISVYLNQSATNLSLTASGASYYAWNTAASSSLAAINPTTNANFKVTGTSSLGCVNTAVQSITLISQPTVTAGATNTLVCFNSPVTLNGGGANTYTWTSSTGSYTNGIAFTPTATASYSVIGSNTAGCVSTNTSVISITVNTLPTLTVVTSHTAICSGNSSTITATGANTYTWSTSSNASSIVVSPASTTNYTVTGTNSLGCTGSSTISLLVTPATSLTVSGNGNNIAQGSTSTSTLNSTDFGSISSRTFVVQNSGSGTLSISSVTLSGTNAADFSVTVVPVSSLTASASSTIVVTFSPSGSGVRSATLNISSNDCANPSFKFAIQGTPSNAETINFDGSNDLILCSNPAALQLSNGTVEAYIKTSNAGAGLRGIVVKELAYGLFLVGNQLSVYNWSTSAVTSAGPLLNDNTWHHVAFTFQSGVANGSQLYIDGSPVGAPFSYAVTSQTTPLSIANNNTFNAQYFNGYIDEVRVWNTIRSNCELQTFKGCEIPTSASGLVANYHFNQGLPSGSNGAVSTLTDASGNGINGTLTNMSLSGSTSNWVSGGAVVSNYSISSPPTASIALSANGNAISQGAISTSTLNNTNFRYQGAQNFTISNSGTGTLNIGGVTLGGSNPSHFSVSVSPASSLSTGASTTLTIMYTNTVYASTSSAVVNISSNDCSNPTYSFVITASVAPNTNSVGYVYTFAGSGTTGSANGTGTLATFFFPAKSAVDATGNIFVTEYGGNNIRKITLNGVVSTFAGTGSGGSTDATGTAASFSNPDGICFDGSGNLYIADYSNNKIRKITSAGVVTTFAGSGTAGSTDATGVSATFNHPTGIAYDGSGNFYVADHLNNKIRKITSAGVVTTFAGSGTASSIDGMGTGATFNLPEDVLVDSQGQIYVSDQSGNKIRKISVSGVVTTFAGSGIAGSTDGYGTSASFNGPSGMCIDAIGNIYIAEVVSKKIRKITPNGLVSTIAGTGASGSTDGITSAATFSNPVGICFDSNGNLVISTYNENKIRKISYTGDALNFDGTNDQVVVGTNSALDVMNNPFTMEAWVYPTLAKNNTILSKGDGNGLANNGDYIFQLDNTNHLSLYMGALNNWKYSTGTVPLNQWSHVAAVYTGSLVNFYINGVLNTFSTVSTNTANSTGYNFYVGRQGQGCNCNFFQGSLDEVRVWNSARSQCQIQTNMNNEIPSTSSGLVANYHFNQGVPSCTNTGVTTVTDAAGSNNGTATNFLLTGNTSNWVSPGGVASNYSVTSQPSATINLSGNGNNIPVGVTTSTSNNTDFGGNTTRTFSITMTGSGTLNIGSVYLSGAGAGQYSIASGPAASLTSGGTSFVVLYTPTVAGTATAIVNIISNDCSNPNYSFVITASTSSASALRLNGSYVQLSDPNFGTSDFCVEGWFKTNTTSGSYLMSTRTSESGAGGNWWNVLYQSGTIGLELGAAAGVTTIVATPTTAIATGVWNHFAAVRNGTAIRVYVNGLLLASHTETLTRNLTTGNNSLRFGAWPNFGVAYLNGEIDEFRIWNTARTQCQIQQFMNAEITSTASGLLYNYHFNQGIASGNNTSITNLTDAAGSNNGTLIGFVLTGSVTNWVSPGAVANGFTTSSLPGSTIALSGNGNNIPLGTSTNTNNFTDFGTNTTRTLVVQNSGTGTLSINGITFTGANASLFSVTASPAATLGASASSSFTILFTPVSAGTASAIVNISSNDCTNPTYSFVITASVTPGAALNFDAVNDYVSVPVSTLVPTGNSPYTIEAKIKANAFGTYGIIGWGNFGGTNSTNAFRLNAGGMLVNYWWSNDLIVSAPTLTDGAWHHVAATWDGTVRKIFVDGIVAGQDYPGANAVASNANMRVGCTAIALSEYFNGGIDEVRVWNIARSACEIQSYKDCEIPTSASGLVLNYHFNQGAAALNNATVTSLVDASGNNLNGTLTNFALSGAASNWVTPGGVVSNFTTIAAPTASISLSGNGNNIANNSISTSTLNNTNFGASYTKTFVITNSGTGTLNINTPYLSGAAASQYSITSIPATTLGASATTSFVVVFTPTTSGTQSAVINIGNNDCTKPNFNYVVQCSATAGEVLSFDGVNDIAARAVLTTNTANISLQAKVYWRGTNGISQMIMYNGNSSNSGYGIYNTANTSTLSFLFGGVNFYPFNYTLTANQWVSLSLVIKNGTAECYANGVLTNQLNIATPGVPSGSFVVGGNNIVTENFNGKIDEVLFWNKALTQCEIQTYQNCEIPTSATNLLANYHFNQGAAGLNNATVTTVTDASGNANNLTLSNFALTGTLSNWVNGGAVVSGFTTTTPPTSSLTISGNGNTITPGSTSTSTLNFTDFGTATNKTFVVQNTGGGTLNINSVSFSGANASQFTFTSGISATFTAGVTGTFSIIFTPTAAGTASAIINITSNDCTNPTYSFVITASTSVASALEFDGTDDYIALPNNASSWTLGNNFSIETWIKPNTTASTQLLLYTGYGCVICPPWALSIGPESTCSGGGTPGRIVFQASDLAGSPQTVYVESNAAPTLSVWTHVAVTSNGSVLKMFINGVLQSTASIGFSIPSATYCNIGADPSSIGGCTPRYFYNGAMDELRFWNYERNQCQIQTFMNAEITSTLSGLTANFDFNQGIPSGTNTSVLTLTDVAASITGTLSSFDLTGSVSNWVSPGGVINGFTTTNAPTASFSLTGNGNNIAFASSSTSTLNNTDFGNNTAKTFSIYNAGTGTLNINNIYFTGTNASQFSVTTLPASSLSTSGSTFVITLTPTNIGISTATVNISSNDCTNPTFSFVITASTSAASALDFDGTDDFIITGIDADTDVMPNTTWEAWAYPTTTAAGYRMVCAIDDGGWDRFLTFFGNEIRIATGNSTDATVTTYTANQWYHLAVVYKQASNQAYVFINGIEYGPYSTAYSGSGITNDNLIIGANIGGSINLFEGKIDEVRVWNTARTQCEIQTYMNAEITTTASGLVGNYHFNQGVPLGANATQTVLVDATGAYNGTLTNFALTTGSTSNWIAPSNIVNGFTTTSAPTSSIALSGNANNIPTGTSTSTNNFTDFGSATTRTFVVQNSGTGTLSVNSIVLTGANASQFSVTTLPASSLTTSGSSFVITLTPTNTGVSTATVNIPSNDCANPNFSFVITASTSPASALNFDGSNDNISGISGISLSNQPFSVEFWAKKNGSGSGLILAQGNIATNQGLQVGFYSTNVLFGFYSNDMMIPFTNDGNWHHWAYVYDANASGTNRFVYQDGILIGSDHANGNYTGTGNLLIGDAIWGSNAFNGSVDELRIWNTARTQCQVQTFMNAEITSTASGLLANYHFNQGLPSGSNSGVITLLDAAGTYSGTLNGFALTGTTSNWLSPGGVSPGFTTTNAPTASISLQGNGNNILNGSVTSNTLNNTSFGLLCVGGNTVSKTYSIINTGTVTLYVNTINLSGSSNFSVGTFPTSVAASSSATFPITFTIGSAGVSNGTINLRSNDCNIPNYNFVISATVNALPTVSVTASATQVCINNSITLSGTGANSYTWTGGITNAVAFSPTTSGTYTVTGTNTLSGCINTAIQSLVVNPIPTVSTSGSPTLCIGGNAQINGNGAITYTWTGISTGSSIIVNPTVTTVYTVTGFDANNCAASAQHTLIVNPLPTISVQSGTICNGNSFTISPSGAGIGGTYTITGGTYVVSPNTNTFYVVIGTSTTGCSSQGVTNGVSSIQVDPTPTITVNSTTICLGQSAIITPSGAATYSINGGSFTVSPLSTSAYTVTGTSAAGCTSSIGAISNIVVNALPTISVNSGTICAGQNFSITPSGGSTYTITGGSFNVTPSITSTYSVTGSSSFGCVSGNTAIASISVFANPTITVNSGSICIGQVFTITPSGANTYTYSSGSNTVNPISNTSYSVTGTSTAGCVSSNTAISSVTVNAVPTIAVNSGSICQGSTFVIVPSGASTYTVSGGSFSVSPLSNSIYSVSGTSSAGCISTVSALSNLTVNVTPTITVNSGTICNGQSFSITPSGGSTYTITGGSFNVTPSITSTYSVTGSSSFGCVSGNTAIASVSVFANPTITVNSGSICVGQVFTITPSGANTYTYSSGSNTVNPISNTSYSVTGTSTAGCVSSNTAISNVTVNAVPTIAVNSGSICQGSTFVIVPSGASTYTVSGGSFSVSPLSNSIYSVSGTSSAGCISTVSALSNLTVNVTPTITVNSGTICNGQSFSITPSGGNTYTITGGSFNVTPSITSTYSVTGSSSFGCVSGNTAIASVSVFANPTITVNSGSICVGQVFTITPSGANTYTYSSGSNTVNPITNTSYSVTGTSTAGCVSSNTAISSVTVNAVPTIAVNSGSICQGSTFVIVPTGASTYTVSGGSFSVSPLSSSIYSVSGTSSAGCISTISALSNLTVNVTPTITVNSGTICNGQSFSIAPSGGSTYTITGGSFNVTPSITSTYSVTGSSSFGCVSGNTAIASVSVFANPTIAVNSGSICVGQVFTITPSGANTYTYSSGSNTVNPISNTSYSVTGTSTAGCVSSNTAISSVTVNAVPTIAVNSGSICQGSTFVIVPTGASTYTVSGGSFSVSPLSNSIYSVSGTSSAGCISTLSALSNLTVNVTPTITVNSGSICSTNSFSIIPAGANTYTISGGSFNVSPLINTTYSITGSSVFGCISSNTALSNVTVFTRPSITVNSGTICSGQIFTMTPSGANTYTYSSGSNTVNPTTNTNYSVTGTSTAGCLSINTVVASVTVNAVPSLSINSGTICSGQSFTFLPGGASTYTISGGNFTISPLSTSSYSLSGTSSAGCLNTITAIALVSVNITPTVSVNSGSICQGSSIAIVPSGANNYTITGNNFTVSPLTTTSYSVIGSSTNGCTSSGSVISNVTVAPTPTIAVSSGSICSGTAFIMNPSGAVSYTYSSGSATVNPINSTSYSVSGTSSLGCVSLTQAICTVSVYATPILTVNNGTICQGSSFTINPSGANTYTITGNSFTVSPLVNTNYTVSGTSTAGCTNTSPAICNLSVNASPTISVNSGTICETKVFTINPTGANTYTISGGSFTVSPINPVNTYSISGTNTNGCISNSLAISTVSVFINPTITAASGSICAGQSFTINPSGAISYTYSSGSAVITPSITNSYSVSGTNTFGCVSLSPAVLSVTVNANPTLSVNSGTICNGQSFTISPSGASTYTISGNNTVVTPSISTAYTVNGTSAQGCSNLTVAISQVTVFALPNVIANTSNSVVCSGQSITLSGAGANSYTWTNNVIDGTSFTPSTTTSYSVIGKDLNGCLNNAFVSVTVNALPSLSVVSSNSSSCIGETVSIVASGANTYSWSNGASSASIQPAPLSSITYTLVGTDLNNCSSTTIFTQTVTNCNSGISVLTYSNHVSCRGKDNAFISLQPQLTYTNHQISYKWDPSYLCPAENCADLRDLKKGVYQVTVMITSTVTPTYVRKDTLQYTFNILDENDPCDINVFHGITANGDAINEVFEIENLQLDSYKNNNVKIYNRWGQLVSEITGYNNTNKAWPSKEELAKLESSTYFYVIDLGDGSKPLKGWIELIKN